MPKNDHIPPRSHFKKPSFVTLNVTLTATFRFDIAFFCNPKRNPNAKNQVFSDPVISQKSIREYGKFHIFPKGLYSIFENCF